MSKWWPQRDDWERALGIPPTPPWGYFVMLAVVALICMIALGWFEKA